VSEDPCNADRQALQLFCVLLLGNTGIIHAYKEHGWPSNGRRVGERHGCLQPVAFLCQGLTFDEIVLRVAETNKKCLVGKGLDWVHGSALPPAFQTHYKNQPFLTLLLDVLRVPR